MWTMAAFKPAVRSRVSPRSRPTRCRRTTWPRWRPATWTGRPRRLAAGPGRARPARRTPPGVLTRPHGQGDVRAQPCDLRRILAPSGDVATAEDRGADQPGDDAVADEDSGP